MTYATIGGPGRRSLGDCGVFEVGDELALGKFNSADRYGALQPGRRYQLTVIGWRVPLFSWFPNIVEAREVAP